MGVEGERSAFKKLDGNSNLFSNFFCTQLRIRIAAAINMVIQKQHQMMPTCQLMGN